MRKYETMAIPVEADGIVNDEVEFQQVMEENEAQLTQEIEESYEDESYDGLNDYEDMELKLVARKDIKLSPEQLARIAKLKQILE